MPDVARRTVGGARRRTRPGVVRHSGAGAFAYDGRLRPFERDPGELRPIGRQRRRPARHLRRCAAGTRAPRPTSAADRLFGAAGGISSMRSSSRRRSLPCQHSRNCAAGQRRRALDAAQVVTVTARALARSRSSRRPRPVPPCTRRTRTDLDCCAAERRARQHERARRSPAVTLTHRSSSSLTAAAAARRGATCRAARLPAAR